MVMMTLWRRDRGGRGRFWVRCLPGSGGGPEGRDSLLVLGFSFD